jgi:hypothetical protein
MFVSIVHAPNTFFSMSHFTKPGLVRKYSIREMQFEMNACDRDSQRSKYNNWQVGSSTAADIRIHMCVWLPHVLLRRDI